MNTNKVTIIAIGNDNSMVCYINTEKQKALDEYRKQFYPKVINNEWKEIKKLLKIKEFEFEKQDKFMVYEIWKD